MSDHTAPDTAENGEFWIEIDEDPEGEAAWLRSVGLDPETATRDDLLRVIDSLRTEAGRAPSPERRPCDQWCDPQTGVHAPWCGDPVSLPGDGRG